MCVRRSARGGRRRSRTGKSRRRRRGKRKKRRKVIFETKKKIGGKMREKHHEVKSFKRDPDEIKKWREKKS